MEQQNSKKLGLYNSIVLLAVTIGALILTLQTQSTVGLAGVVLLGIGTLIGFFSFIQSHLIDRERLEALEMQELDRTRGNESLFAGAAEDAYPARNARRQFEKWVVPGFSVLVLVGQVLGLLLVYIQLRGGWNLSDSLPDDSGSALPTMFFALFMVVLFMMGKYSAGLAKMDGQDLLRPGANYMLLGSVVSAAVVLAQAASSFGHPVWDKGITWVVLIVITVSALENLITLALELFRPRLDDKKTRLLYESRLIGLLGQPGGLISTAAQAMDYQFGFKVSETRFYKILEQRLALIIAIQATVLFLSSCFVVIQANEEAVKERFGGYDFDNDSLKPGFHFKWPWPIDKVYRYKTGAIQSFKVGVEESSTDKPEDVKVLLWTTQHSHGSSTDPEQNFNMIVASDDVLTGAAASKAVPVNLLTVSIPVHYRISNLTNWVYKTDNAPSMLKKFAEREVTQYLANSDMNELMGSGRTEAQIKLKERIDKHAKELGAEIVFVGLQDIHPPVGQNEQSKQTGGVAESYEKVNVAHLHAETNRLGAIKYQAGKVPQARGDATNLVAQARSDSTNKVALADAEAGRFGHQLAAFKGAPSVYKTRMKLETFIDATKGSRKYILTNPSDNDIINLELQDKLRSDLLDVTVDPEN